MTIFIAHAPADASVAQELAAWLKTRASLAELQTADRPGRPLHSLDARVVFWSQAATMQSGRMALEQLALDAWAEGRLILVRLDHSFLPTSLRDLPSIDATFAARREFTWGEIADAARAIARPKPADSGAIDAPSEGPASGPAPDDLQRRYAARARAAPKVPSWRRILFGGRHAKKGASPTSFEGPSAPESAQAEAGPQAAPPPLFISYASADSAEVLPKVDALGEGVPIWIDRKGLKSGQGWAGEIVAAIRSAKRVLVMCSPRAFESPHVLREVYLASRFEKPLLPVFLEETDPPDDFLYHFADVQWLKLYAVPEADRASALAAAALA